MIDLEKMFAVTLILFFLVMPLAPFAWAIFIRKADRSGVTTADLVFAFLRRLGVAIIGISLALSLFDFDPVPLTLVGAGIAAGSILARPLFTVGLWVWRRMDRRVRS